MVKLYALSTCPWCKKAKQFFTQKQIPFECIEVDLLQGGERKKTVNEVKILAGDMVFPVTIIDGEVIIGFKPDAYEEALAKQQIKISAQAASQH